MSPTFTCIWIQVRCRAPRRRQVPSCRSKLRLLTRSKNKTYLSDALPVLMIGRRIEQKWRKQVLKTSSSEWGAQRDCARTLRCIPGCNELTPLASLSKVEFLAKQFKDELCLQLGSAVGTLGSGYSCSPNGFLIRSARVGEAVQEIFTR